MGDSLLRLLSLKSVLRQGWTRHPIPPAAIESVADHSYGVALLAWVLCPDGLDREAVMELALLHDLAEAITGDLTPADNVPVVEKRRSEQLALGHLLDGHPVQDKALGRLAEYSHQSSPEARFVKAMDKLDMALQSLAYEGHYGVDLSEFRESARAVLQASGYAGLVFRTAESESRRPGFLERPFP
jgi:putative hydrolase of HD superfamily